MLLKGTLQPITVITGKVINVRLQGVRPLLNARMEAIKRYNRIEGMEAAKHSQLVQTLP